MLLRNLEIQDLKVGWVKYEKLWDLVFFLHFAIAKVMAFAAGVMVIVAVVKIRFPWLIELIFVQRVKTFSEVMDLSPPFLNYVILFLIKSPRVLLFKNLN